MKRKIVEGSIALILEHLLLESNSAVHTLRKLF